MAVAFDAVLNSLEDTGNDGAISASFTCSGANRLLLVLASIRIVNDGTTTAPTYNGVSLTLADQIATNTGARVQAYYLIAPATGSNTLAWSRTPFDHVALTIISFTGVHQTTPLGTAVKENVDTYSASGNSIDITSATGDMTVDVVAFGDDAVQTLISPTQTQRTNVHAILDGGGNGQVLQGVSTAAGSASNTHGWTLSDGIANPLKCAHMGFNIAAAAAGASPALLKIMRWYL